VIFFLHLKFVFTRDHRHRQLFRSPVQVGSRRSGVPPPRSGVGTVHLSPEHHTPPVAYPFGMAVRLGPSAPNVNCLMGDEHAKQHDAILQRCRGGGAEGGGSYPTGSRRLLLRDVGCCAEIKWCPEKVSEEGTFIKPSGVNTILLLFLIFFFCRCLIAQDEIFIPQNILVTYSKFEMQQ